MPKTKTPKSKHISGVVDCAGNEYKPGCTIAYIGNSHSRSTNALTTGTLLYCTALTAFIEPDPAQEEAEDYYSSVHGFGPGAGKTLQRKLKATAVVVRPGEYSKGERVEWTLADNPEHRISWSPTPLHEVQRRTNGVSLKGVTHILVKYTVSNCGERIPMPHTLSLACIKEGSYHEPRDCNGNYTPYEDVQSSFNCVWVINDPIPED